MRNARANIRTRARDVGSRGVVLLMCLIVIIVGALLVTTILYSTDAGRHAAEVGFRSTQSRSMAWSGVQAALAELAGQRDELLQGKPAKVTAVWTALGVDAEPGQTRWGFRLLKLDTSVLGAEMGKLDVNSATVEMLSKLGGVTPELAGAIVNTRKTRRFASTAELLKVPGMTAELLYGTPALGAPPAETPAPAPPSSSPSASTATGGASEADGHTPSVEAAPPRHRPLADDLTVFSFDPEVQIGFGDKGAAAKGDKRINLNLEWSDALGEAIERRFDKGVADGVKGLLQQGQEFKKPSDIVKKLREFSIKPEDWSEVLDAFTTSADDYRLGCIDLSTASPEVLACVPGVSREAAKDIVFRREKIDEERRRTVVWPVLEGALTEEDFEKAVDWLTTRCMQWRVVVEGGVLPASADEEGMEETPRWEGSPAPEGGEVDRAAFARAMDGRSPDRVQERFVLEAVLDLSGRRPRVAMLRDVTYLPLAAMLAAQRSTERAEAEDGAGGDSKITAPNGGAAHADASGQAGSGGSDAGHDLALDELIGPELSFGNEGRGATSPSPAGPAPSGSSGASSGAGGAEGGGGAGGAGGAGQDNRIGRWTTGAGGGR